MSEQPQSATGEGVRLQQFGLKDSAYARPNQDWVCGHRDEGSPCTIGPDGKGRCLTTAECRPVKKGDRWSCTRRDATTTPCPCAEGPLPDGSCAHPVARCSPVRSMRAKRGRFAFGAFALSIGLLTSFLFSPLGAEFVEPGELSDAHAEALKVQQTDECAACHDAGKHGANQWLRLALTPGVGAVQNSKCLKCHLSTLGPNAALPHSLAVGTFDRLAREAAERQRLIAAAGQPAAPTAAATEPATQPANPETADSGGPRTIHEILASFAPRAATTPEGNLACSTCHQEHGGRHQNLKAMSDASCQVCHKVQFVSFANGHPEFKGVRQDHAGIIFDHNSHQPRMPGAKLDCATCHRGDPSGKTMAFTSFEQACVGCHDQGKFDHHGDQIRSEVRMVLQLPAMDVGAPGIYPDKALTPGATLTPILQFLIAGDQAPAALDALKSLYGDVQAKGSTDDWAPDDPKAKAQLAAAIERAINDLVLDDPSPLRARVARAAGLPEDSAVVMAFVDQLAAAKERMKDWQQHTLPHLADYLTAKPEPASAPSSSPSTSPATMPAGAEGAPGAAPWMPPMDVSRWFTDTAAVSVNFGPTHANGLDKSWIDVLARGSNPAKPSKFVDKMNNDDFRAALLFQSLLKNAGVCTKCHAIQTGPNSLYVNWEAAGHATRAAGYVKFDHRPHVTMYQGAEGCANCHKVTSATAATASSADMLPSGPPNHSMAAHDKATCASCHNPAGAPDTCLTCHVYHMIR